MAFYSSERLALFIDGANLYSAAKALGVEIDYRKLLSEFRSKGRLLRAYYYTALLDSEEYSPIRKLVDWLQYNGYNVVSKTAREFTDREGRRRIKGNMDVEITIDMLNIAAHVDHVVLFSGDGDFVPLVEALKDRGIRVSIVSTIQSAPSMASDELRRSADAFIDLADLEGTVTRPRREFAETQGPGEE